MHSFKYFQKWTMNASVDVERDYTLLYLKRRISPDIKEVENMMDHEDGDLMITLAGSVAVPLEGVVPGVELVVRLEDAQEAETSDPDMEATAVGTLETMLGRHNRVHPP